MELVLKVSCSLGCILGGEVELFLLSDLFFKCLFSEGSIDLMSSLKVKRFLGTGCAMEFLSRLSVDLLFSFLVFDFLMVFFLKVLAILAMVLLMQFLLLKDLQVTARSSPSFS